MLVICEFADKCESDACLHKKQHEPIKYSYRKCTSLVCPEHNGATCVPVIDDGLNDMSKELKRILDI